MIIIEKELLKTISGKRENFSKPNYIAGNSSEGLTPGLYPSRDTRDHNLNGRGKNFNKWTRGQEN